MKKIISLVVIALVLVIASCNKDKQYTKDITGTWTVYKYLYKNVDETAQWMQANPNWNITFNANGTFVLKDNGTVHQDTVVNGNPLYDTTYATTTTGTYAFANHYINLVLTDSSFAVVDSALVTVLVNQTYTIFDLSGANVELSTDTTQFYMVKKGY
jgi:hypothetical protein